MNGESECYRAMPTAKSAQQTLRNLDSAVRSYKAALEDCRENPDKYKSRPKLPYYLDKTDKSRYVLTLTNQDCRLRGNTIYFPKKFNGFALQTKIKGSFQQVRIHARRNYIIVEVVYTIEVPVLMKDNGRYMGIDLGLNNLAAVTTNTGMIPVLINGRGLKSEIKHYSKKMADCQKVAKEMNGLHETNKMSKLTLKMNNYKSNVLHQASRIIVKMAVEQNVSAIVIGYSEGWKDSINLGKVTNQSFVAIPHKRLVEMIKYKAEQLGISVILTDEKYTSGTSFLDQELPIKANYNISRRKKRGLFVSNNGLLINADVNASFQIIKKVFPNAFDHLFANGICGAVARPAVVNAVKAANGKKREKKRQALA
jgi:putative transposase